MAAMAAGAPAASLLKLPQRVRIAIIGVEGHIAQVTEAMPLLPDAEIVAAAHTMPGKAAARFPQAKAYADYRKMLDEIKPDVVAVGNTNGERAEAVIECLRRDVHVLAEKPLGVTLGEYEQVAKAMARSKGKLTTMMTMRGEPPYIALRGLVEEGAIGEVVQMDAQKSYKAPAPGDWRFTPRLYGGTIPWIGIHMIDLMRWVGGRDFTETWSVQAVKDYGFTHGMESVTGSVFRMDNGGAALMRMDYFRPKTAPTHGDDRLRLVGSKGIAEYMASTGVTLMTQDAGPRKIVSLPAKRFLFAEFLDHVYNGKPEPISAKDIDRANRITLLAAQSAATGKVVKLA
jgi:predicted dehydrogenase